MTTLSIPIGSVHEELIASLIKKGYGANKADVVRKALTLLAEEQAVAAVLKAQSEPTIKGDLRQLVKKF